MNSNCLHVIAVVHLVPERYGWKVFKKKNRSESLSGYLQKLKFKYFHNSCPKAYTTQIKYATTKHFEIGQKVRIQCQSAIMLHLNRTRAKFDTSQKESYKMHMIS